MRPGFSKSGCSFYQTVSLIDLEKYNYCSGNALRIISITGYTVAVPVVSLAPNQDQTAIVFISLPDVTYICNNTPR